MPTQFNTKDSGRHTEESTDSHGNTCLQNDTIFFIYFFILQRMHRKQRHEHQPWMTLLFQCQSPGKTRCAHTHTPARAASKQAKQASKRTKPHDRRSGFPEPPHFAPLQREAAAAAAATHFCVSGVEKLKFKKKKWPGLDLFTCVRRSKSSHLPSLRLGSLARGFASVMVGAPLCVFQRHVINAERGGLCGPVLYIRAVKASE